MKRWGIIILIIAGLVAGIAFVYSCGGGGGDSGGDGGVDLSNVPPVAKNDTYAVIVGDTLNVPPSGVLGNDTDADSDPLTCLFETGVFRGTLSSKPDGSFIYSPNPGYIGTDSFTYRAHDGTDDSNVATVTIWVQEELVGVVEEVVTWDSGSFESGSALGLQPDGKILVTGHTSSGSADVLLLRFITDGSLDTGFGTEGAVTWNGYRNGDDFGSAVAVQPDGKILVTGTSYAHTYNLILLRYNNDGSLDTDFGNSGEVIWDNGDHDGGDNLLLQPDGKILVTGYSETSDTDRDILLLRYNPDGNLDTSFGTEGAVTWDGGSDSDSGSALALQPDGKILVAGYSWSYAIVFLLRYNADGSLDANFGTGGAVIWDTALPGYGYDLALQPDGKILVGGKAYSSGTGGDVLLLRFNTDGTLDTEFGTDGAVTWDGGMEDSGNALGLQPDGKILVAGTNDKTGGDRDVLLIRFNTNGGLDTGFGTGGAMIWDNSHGDHGLAMALQPDGSALVAGVTHNDTNFDVLLLKIR